MKNSNFATNSVALFCLAFSLPASAALFSSLNGKAYYDDVLDITWLADASYAKTTGYHPTGRMTWYLANTWANTLEIDGISGWRLPMMVDIGNDGCQYSRKGNTDCGYNVLTGSASTAVYSEFASLWYDTLGNHALFDSLGNQDPMVGLNNRGPFINLKEGGHWTNLAYAPSPGNAWFFATNVGNQDAHSNTMEMHAWPVHPGDLRLLVDTTLNGWGASLAPGPAIPDSGASGRWKYTLENTSDKAVYDVYVYSMEVQPEPTDIKDLVCYLDKIPAGGFGSCSIKRTVEEGSHQAVLSMEGVDSDGNKVTGSSTTWYRGGIDFSPSLAIKVTVFDRDFDNEIPGHGVDEDGDYYHTINVSNTGDALLRDVRVYDRLLAPTETGWTLTCVFPTLLPGESSSCQKALILTDYVKPSKRHFTAQTFFGKEKIKVDDFSYYHYVPWEH